MYRDKVERDAVNARFWLNVGTVIYFAVVAFLIVFASLAP